jgi:hypothetical protein
LHSISPEIHSIRRSCVPRPQRGWDQGSPSVTHVSRLPLRNIDSSAYNQATVYTNDKIKPRLQRQVGILVAEYLEAKRVVCRVIGVRLRRFGIEPAYKPVESPEHYCGGNRKCFLLKRMSRIFSKGCLLPPQTRSASNASCPERVQTVLTNSANRASFPAPLLFPGPCEEKRKPYGKNNGP